MLPQARSDSTRVHGCSLPPSIDRPASIAYPLQRKPPSNLRRSNQWERKLHDCCVSQAMSSRQAPSGFKQRVFEIDISTGRCAQHSHYAIHLLCKTRVQIISDNFDQSRITRRSTQQLGRQQCSARGAASGTMNWMVSMSMNPSCTIGCREHCRRSSNGH